MFTSSFVHKLQTCAQYSFRGDKKLCPETEIKKKKINPFFV